MSYVLEFFVIVYFAHWFIEVWKRRKVDETDKSPAERSGLLLYIDYGTGVEYVATSHGGLTPRVDAEGKPMVRGNYMHDD